jgi:uncharacterized protein (TIGR03118 family)
MRIHTPELTRPALHFFLASATLSLAACSSYDNTWWTWRRSAYHGAAATPVLNATPADFLGDTFIVSTEDGMIAGRQTGVTALRVDNSANGAAYKGLDILDTGVGHVICAANFSQGTVDVFDASYHAITLSGGFVDPSPIAGFAPFNVFVDGGSVYVTYAKQDAEIDDDVSGPGDFAVDVFDTTGAFVTRLEDE